MTLTEAAELMTWSLAERIVHLTIDDPDKRVNTVDARFGSALRDALDRLEAERDHFDGVVIRSGKDTFVAGGDLHELLSATRENADALLAQFEELKRQYRRLETLGRPVAAVICGSALGGGLELALACHYRVAVPSDRTEVGLPEVGLGLLPGGGGVVRTVRMFGLERALDEVLLHGQRYRATAAREVGLVDDIAADPDEALARAIAWIRDNPEATQPWDRPGYSIPGHLTATARLPVLTAQLNARLKGAPTPAPRAVLAAAAESAQVDLETALTLESRYLVQLAMDPVSKNIIRSTFFDRKKLRNGASRPPGPAHTVRRALVLGAGVMGAGIAHSLAAAGVEVIVKDVDAERAQRALTHAAGLVRRDVDSGRASAAEGAALLARISTTTRLRDATGRTCSSRRSSRTPG